MFLIGKIYLMFMQVLKKIWVFLESQFVYQKKILLKKIILTSYINAHNHINKNSAFNTPPTFSIYVMLNILNWIMKWRFRKNSKKIMYLKANKIYRFLDENSDKFNMSVPKEFRSYSNIVFDFKDEKPNGQIFTIKVLKMVFWD